MSRLDVPENWKLLSELDESADYEVDISQIYQDGEKFVLVTASGCSCWNGDFETQEFDSLDKIEEAVLNRSGEYVYNPSLTGAKTLVDEARLVVVKS